VRSRRRRTLHPDQRALPFAELACAEAIYAYSFILTNLDVSSKDNAKAVEHWYRHRTSIENVFILSGFLACGMTSPDRGGLAGGSVVLRGCGARGW
jgi:hypothetical protein